MGKIEKNELGRVYLAAPFFNAEQIALLEQMEQLMDLREVDYYSPRKQHFNQDVTVRTPAEALEVFEHNYKAINGCNTMMAVIDWLLPERQALRLVTEYPNETEDGEPVAVQGIDAAIIGKPILLPDSGTVWEMGAAYALCKPVVMYTNRLYKGKHSANLMLSQCAEGVCYGIDMFRAWLRHGNRVLKAWKGGYV